MHVLDQLALRLDVKVLPVDSDRRHGWRWTDSSWERISEMDIDYYATEGPYEFCTSYLHDADALSTHIQVTMTAVHTAVVVSLRSRWSGRVGSAVWPVLKAIKQWIKDVSVGFG